MKSYINKVKGNLSIYTNRKTSNLLDGSYRSIFKGKSMNFDDLREYIQGDNIKDIDWKASARSRSLLVKQFVAEKKHNLLLIVDSNKKMFGVSTLGDVKKEIALMCAGTLGYIGIKNNDVVSTIFYGRNDVIFNKFKSRTDNLEVMLAKCDSEMNEYNNSNLNDTLNFVRTRIANRMIITIITDIEGLETMNDKFIRELCIRNDVMVVCISDSYFFGDNLFNLDKNSYIPRFFTKSKKLLEQEKEIRKSIYHDFKRKFGKYRVNVVIVNSCEEIPFKIIKLLEEHKYGI